MSITEIRNGISYTVPNDRRGYQPPPAQQEWRAPDVTAPAVKAEGSVVQQAHKAVVHAHNEFRKHLDATEAIRGNFTEDGYRAQVAEFQNTSAAKAVDAALESVVARRDAAAEHVAKVKRDLSPPADTAGELRSTRYRDRMHSPTRHQGKRRVVRGGQRAYCRRDAARIQRVIGRVPDLPAIPWRTSDWIDARVARWCRNMAQPGSNSNGPSRHVPDRPTQREVRPSRASPTAAPAACSPTRHGSTPTRKRVLRAPAPLLLCSPGTQARPSTCSAAAAPPQLV